METINLEVMNEFKQFLIDNQDNFYSWKEVHDVVYMNLVFDKGLDYRLFPTKDEFRQRYFKAIQQDDEWIEDNGLPISKNGVGIKITKDLKEIKQYIKTETKRAKALFTKLKPIKKHYTRLNHLINFTQLGD